MSVVRRLGVGEWELYKSVRLESLRDSPEAFSSLYEDAVERSEESWVNQVDASAVGKDRATFVVLDDGVVGVGALYRDSNDPDVGELLQVWVNPEKRGGSVAVDLLDGIFVWVRGNGFLRVKAEVMVSNVRALRFYERFGFVRVESEESSNVILVKDV